MCVDVSSVGLSFKKAPPLTEAQIMSPRIERCAPRPLLTTPRSQRTGRSAGASDGGRPVIAKTKGGFTNDTDKYYSWAPTWRRLDSPKDNAPPSYHHLTASSLDEFPLFPRGECPFRQNHHFRRNLTGDGSVTARSGLASPRGARRNGLWLSTAFVY